MDKELVKILNIIDREPDRFSSSIPAVEKKVFRQVSLLLKDLALSSDGKIIANIENLNLINSIQSKLNKILVSKEYADLVKKFVGNMPAISNYQTSLNNVPTDTKKLISAVTRQNINNTTESLIGSGYKQEVVSKLKNVLLTSVTSGGSYSDLIANLRNQIVSTDEKPGMISKYARTYVVDSLGQLAGQGNKLISDELNSEWYQYVGSNIETTREFCLYLTKKRYVHKSEIPDLIKGKINGHQCKISQSTGLPLGMIEGTDRDNFIVLRGGYNCGHELIPVSVLSVPANFQIDIAKKSVDNFDTLSHDIAKKLNVEVTPVNIKSDKRIIEKAENEYNGDVSKVKDIVRNTFIAPSNAHGDIIKEIKNNFDIVKIKEQKTDRLGYSGILINVRNENGTLSEIQINTPQMIYAKDTSAKHLLSKEVFEKIKIESGLEAGKGHLYYEKYRVLDELTDMEEMEKIAKESTSYYEKIKGVKL